MTGFRDWLTHTAAYTTTIFREGTPPGAGVNNCIEWARTQTLVLEALGVKARAVPVDVMVGNMAAHHQLMHNEPLTDEQVAAGAWTLGVYHGQQGPTGGWDGHLVVTVRQPSGPRILLDGTADQFARPARGIDVPALVMMNLPALWAEPVFTHPDRHTGIIRYIPMPPQAPAAQVWKGSNAWNNPNLPPTADWIVDQLDPWVDVA